MGGLKRKLSDDSDDDVHVSANNSVAPCMGLHRLRASGGRSKDNQDLPLNTSLKRMWAENKISSAVVQEVALNAGLQGASGLDRFAAAGAEGMHRGNLFRDICAAFGEPLGAPAMKWFRIPTAHGHCLIPVLLLHLLNKTLHRENKEFFMLIIMGGYENL